MSTYTHQRTHENTKTGEQTDKYVFDNGDDLIATRAKIKTGLRTTWRLNGERITAAAAQEMLDESIIVAEIPEELPTVEADDTAAQITNFDKANIPSTDDLIWLENVASEARENGWTVDDSTDGVVLGERDWTAGRFEFACKVNELIGRSAVVRYFDTAGGSKYLPISPWQMTRQSASEPVLVSPYFYI